MSQLDQLHVAEIPHEGGGIRYRYSRYLSSDGSRWIRHGLFTEFHQGGAKASEGQYAHGQEEGVWQFFHLNGQLAAEGTYCAGKEEGVWRYWSETGQEEPPVRYKGGEEDA